MENNQKRLLWLLVCGFVFVRGLPAIDNDQQYVIEEILEEELGIDGENSDEDGWLLRAGLNETEAVQTKVLYTGSQVWKVRIENSKQLRVLSEIRKQKGICVFYFTQIFG